MSFANDFENDLLLLIFNNTDIANLGDLAGVLGSTADGSLYVSLHTADVGEAGNQSTNEVAYTGYGRVAVARTVGGWTVTGNAFQNAAAITFGQCTAGSATATHFAIGLESTGATRVVAYGSLTASLSISAGVTPNFPAGNITGTLD